MLLVGDANKEALFVFDNIWSERRCSRIGVTLSYLLLFDDISSHSKNMLSSLG